MKYVAQTDGTFVGFDEKSETYAQLKKVPKDRRPAFLSADDKDVKAYLSTFETPHKAKKSK